MHESQLTSYLVYNYLKERGISESCPPNQNSSGSTKLNVKMEYEQLISQPSPTKIGLHSNNRPKYRSFYAPNSKKIQSVRKMERIYKLKKLNQTPVQHVSFVPSQQKIKFNRVSVGFQLESPSFMFNKTKKQERTVSEEITKFRNQGIYNTQHAFFEKVGTTNEKTKKSSKYGCSKKFGLDIRQIKKMSAAKQKDKSQKLELFKEETRNEALQGKCQNIHTLDPTYSIDQTLMKQKLQQSFKTEKSEQLHKISRIIPSKTRKSFLSIKEKKDDERSIENRLERMFNYFAVILYSHGCFSKLTSQQSPLKQKGIRKKAKYTFYVGSGNNKNLIISIFKKRWWWAEAEDISSANFVWTQLKVPSIMQNQPSMLYSDMQMPNPEAYRSSESFSKLQKKNFSVISKHYERLFHPTLSCKFHKRMSQEQQKRRLRQLKPPAVLHNHYEANYMLGNKKALFHNLVTYYNYLNKDVFTLIPKTYHIQKINSRSWKIFENEAKEKKNALWVVKPGQNSNRGKGIFVANSIAKIKKKFESKKDKSRTFIIQKYIKNLFLFQKRKFDIRTYLLMVTIGGVTKFYWYSEGYLRTSSQIYDLADLDDPFIHLTNDAIQVKNDNYGKYEAGNKISYHEFQRHLDTNYPNEKHSMKELSDEMKNTALEAVKATYFKLDPALKEESFELFGIDFIIDSNFKPWLLEINTNPCLQLSSPCLQRLIPHMLENAFRIAVDPVFQPGIDFPRSYMCYVPDNLVENNRFQLIFDSLFDRDLDWQRVCLEMSQKIQYQDEDQQFEGDGDIINIDF